MSFKEHQFCQALTLVVDIGGRGTNGLLKYIQQIGLAQPTAPVRLEG